VVVALEHPIEALVVGKVMTACFQQSRQLVEVLVYLGIPQEGVLAMVVLVEVLQITGVLVRGLRSKEVLAVQVEATTKEEVVGVVLAAEDRVLTLK